VKEHTVWDTWRKGKKKWRGKTAVKGKMVEGNPL